MLSPKKYFILRSLGYKLISEVVDSETGKPRGIIIKKIDTEEQFEVCFTAGYCKPYLPDELKFLGVKSPSVREEMKADKKNAYIS